jgi:hypothetical protein
VHNPTAHSRAWIPPGFSGSKNVRVHAAYLAHLRIFLAPALRCEICAANFLNCTKNIGLTPRPFARTVTFALKQKMIESKAQDTNWAGNELPLPGGLND